MSLANKALLVSLNISMWTARKFDRTESEAVSDKYGAIKGSARVNKSLLPGAQSLRDVALLAGNIRTEYYQMTLPWMENMQILKSEGYLAFTQEMNRHQRAWERLVDKFIGEYPALRDDARARLNGLYSDADYPPTHEVRAKFKFDMAFYPVPDSKDWRVQLSDSETDYLRRQIEDKVMSCQGRAMREAWDRIYKVVSKAQERLADLKNVFRDTLIENARELCEILPTLNIADDPHLESMRDEVERRLCAYDPDDLRNNDHVRLAVADQLKDMMERMAPFMGAA